MCLITEQTKPEITTKDIVVWKVLKNMLSITFPAKWTRGKLKRAKLNWKNSICPDSRAFFDNRSYDAYRDTTEFIIVSTGLHAFCTKNRNPFCMEFNNYKLHKMLIPAGSKIFKDKTGLIVSNQMILIK